jgi:hypothetical protein
MHERKYKDITDYFDSLRGDGFVRTAQIAMENETELLKMIFNRTNLDEIASNYLGIKKNNLYFSAKIDSLLKINTSRKYLNGYDDALEYHRDVDSLKFVKAFIYLNDVEDGCGHHELFLNSHHNIPFKLRFLQRVSSEDITINMPNVTHYKVIGTRGFSWIENTTCFHRGTIPVSGDRLLLSLSFNDSTAALIHENVYFPLKS